MDIDSKEALLEHKNKIQSKAFLNKIYLNFYHQLKSTKIPKGKIVELGSGAGFIKEIIPNTITSDIVDGPGIDKVFSASKMPFKDKTISAFLMIDVLHHIKKPEKALKEMQRSLKKSGKIVMIEPYCSIWCNFIYKNFHPEKNGFDTNTIKWEIPGKGRMSDANPAMPWIIFVRDKEKFSKKFPKLKVAKIKLHTPFKYLISGGLTNHQFLPASLYDFVDKIEKKLSIFNKYMAMFMTIELEKI